MAYVYLKLEKHNDPPNAGFEGLGSLFAHYDAFLSADTETEGFVVNTLDPQEGEQTLRQIRCDHQQCLKPVFLAHECGRLADSLADGIVHSADEAIAKARSIQELAKTLPDHHDPEHKEERLLRYLYLRPELTLEPLRDWKHPQVYHYPLVDVLAHETSTQTGWLMSLMRRDLLEPIDLVDRLRACPECNDAHVSFIDVCPACQSIVIEQESFLHCYACGLVAPQENFIASTGLRCGKCHTQLKHIGVDYDRTLDNFSCRNCKHIFVDPEIKARCHICDWEGDSDDLLLRRVESLRLSEAGRLSVRRGGLADVFKVLDSLNYANPGYFKHMADWFITLTRRYPDTPFALVCVKLDNILELVDSLGRNRVMLMMDGLTERLRELIRTTDIATRTGESYFWLLLPHTPEAGCRVVTQRIEDFQHQTRQESGEELIIRTSFAVGPGSIGDNENAELIMARLKGELA